MYTSTERKNSTIAVVGAGPAGLFACECLLREGFLVSLYDRMPSPGCKFLVAGSHGGLNITNDTPLPDFASQYGENQERFESFLSEFSPTDMNAWLSRLRVATFTGSGGKIFPKEVRAAEILSRCMNSLRSFSGFSFFPNHSFSAVKDTTLIFSCDDGLLEVTPAAVIFALGGASWPATGSDGAWTKLFAAKNIPLQAFESANCGFEADWSPYLKKTFSNLPLKNICMTVGETQQRGEIMLTPYGIEGSLVYSLGLLIRKEIQDLGNCTLFLDLMPDWSIQKIMDRLADGPGKETLSNYFRKKLGLEGVALSLVRENIELNNLKNPEFVSARIKRLPITVYRSRPIEEAISSAGGVCFDGLDDNLMVRNYPGWFCAGEMLDWEAPTGGFLIQGCFSTAFRAACGVSTWLRKEKPKSRGDSQ